MIIFRFLQFFPVILAIFLKPEHMSTSSKVAKFMQATCGKALNTDAFVRSVIKLVAEFSALVNTLLRKSVSVELTYRAEIVARIYRFRDMFAEVFHPTLISKSRFIHSLLHLPDNIEYLGPMWVAMEDVMETSHLWAKWVCATLFFCVS
jgi:hypothetical protein